MHLTRQKTRNSRTDYDIVNEADLNQVVSRLAGI